MQVLLSASKEVARIEAEEAAARAAAMLASAADDDAALSDDEAPYGYSSRAAPRPTGPAARIADALKRSPLMLDLPAGARGLEAVTSLVGGRRGRVLGCAAGCCGVRAGGTRSGPAHAAPESPSRCSLLDRTASACPPFLLWCFVAASKHLNTSNLPL